MSSVNQVLDKVEETQKPRKALQEEFASISRVDHEIEDPIEEHNEFTEVVSKSTLKKQHQLEKAAASLQVSSLRNLNNGSLKNTKKIAKETQKELLDGPTVTVFCGFNVARAHVPMRALMAISPHAHEYFSKKPKTHEIHFKTGDAEAMGEILAKLEKSLVSFSLPFAQSFSHGLKLYQAAHLLDVQKYAASILRYLRNTVQQRIVEYAELDEVIARISVSDALFSHVAHTLAHFRYLKQIPDSEQFDRYLQGKRQADLKAAMEQIDKDKSASRKVAKKEYFREQAREKRQVERTARPAKLKPSQVSLASLPIAIDHHL